MLTVPLPNSQLGGISFICIETFVSEIVARGELLEKGFLDWRINWEVHVCDIHGEQLCRHDMFGYVSEQPLSVVFSAFSRGLEWLVEEFRQSWFAHVKILNYYSVGEI